MTTPTTSAIGTLLSDLREETTTLLRQEVALAKAELSDNTRRLAAHTLAVAVGGAIAYAGMIVLLIGLGYLAHQGLIAAGLSEAVAQWLGFVSVGAVVAIVGYVMFASAKKAMSADDLLPRQTMASLRANQNWAEEKIHTVTSRHEPASQ